MPSYIYNEPLRIQARKLRRQADAFGPVDLTPDEEEPIIDISPQVKHQTKPKITLSNNGTARINDNGKTIVVPAKDVEKHLNPTAIIVPKDMLVDATKVLTNLGFQSKQVVAALSQVEQSLREEPKLDFLIRAGLKELTK